jgi:hypothetical protein
VEKKMVGRMGMSELRSVSSRRKLSSCFGCRQGVELILPLVPGLVACQHCQKKKGSTGTVTTADNEGELTTE